MTSLLGNIDAIRQKLIRDRFVRELEQCKISTATNDDNTDKTTDNEPNWNDDRIKTLETIINQCTDKMKSSEPKKSLSDDLTEVNNLIYKKAWNRLPNFHKSIKMKEYVQALIKDIKLQKRIINSLTKLINENKLVSPSVVTYDSVNCTIRSIAIIVPNNETGIYEIIDTTFNKPWDSLIQYHKIIKMKEYVISTIKDVASQTDILDKLTKLINKDKLTKTDIIYDAKSAIVKSIPILIQNETTKVYEIKKIDETSS